MTKLLKRVSIAAFFLMISQPSAFSAILINGAGATFPYPLYSKWFSEYQKVKPEVQINYQSIGSGGGIRQFQEHTVDFGATDSPMTDEQLAKQPGSALHIPTALGAVVITYNLPELKKPLNLSSEVLAELFLGKIKKWNDPKIKALNADVTLADAPVMIVHRSDGSGTTGIFTDYLAKASADWKKAVGAGTAVNWPVGLGGKGNEGVTGLLKQTPGSIGYVELIYAKNNQLPFASLKNKAGVFVAPSTESVSAAAAASIKGMPADFRISITDATSKGAYPISGFTYLLINQKMTKEKGPAIVSFLKWAMKDGQNFSEPLFYAKLPKELTKKVEAKIETIKIE